MADPILNTPISNIPILLFPLKLETRFVKINNGNTDSYQLWIRAFPDQVFLQSHNAILSEEEKTDAIAFKTLLSDEQKRSVWEELVAKYGVYRASWIVQISEQELELQDTPEEENETSFNFKWLPHSLVFYLYKEGDKAGSPSYSDSGSFIDKEGLIALGEGENGDYGDKWLQDFDIAIDAGMGIKIDLADDDDMKFERIIVSGFRVDTDHLNSAKGLVDLFDNHKYTEGFSFLEYGTPTNNSENVKSGHSIREEFEVRNSYEYAVEGLELDTPNNPSVSDVQSQTAGKYLARILGFDTDKLKHTKNADLVPETLNELYQKATWFALGAQPLFMLFGDQISNETHDSLWQHYSKYVKSKGLYQTLKIGDQPYGILPVMNISSVLNSQIDSLFDKMIKIFALLLEHWIDMVDKKETEISDPTEEGDTNENYIIPRLIGEEDTKEEVLRILSMQEYSTTYQIRSLEYNAFKGKAYDLLRQRPQNQSILEFLNELGEDYTLVKENIESFANLLEIDHQELSNELDQLLRAPIVSFTEGDSDLITFKEGRAVTVNIEGTVIDRENVNSFSFTQQDLTKFQEFIDQLQVNNDDQLVQYTGELSLFTDLFIKSYNNAVQLYHREISFDLPFAETNLDSLYTLDTIQKEEETIVTKGEPVLRIRDRELKMIEIKAPFDGKIDKHFLESNQEIGPGTALFSLINEEKYAETKESFMALGQQIINTCNEIPEGEEREKAQAAAIGQAIDLNSYRLDAWITSLAGRRLEEMRDKPNYEKGIYFGAYGFLENLKAGDTIADIGLMTDLDSKKGGIIHTPGTAQNIASSVFKNSYLSHKHELSSNPFATNLTSDRLQKGELLLDGIRQDQQLEALLGYQLERHLHENDLHNEIYQLREAFPLYENTIGDTTGFVNLSVIDGLKAIKNKANLEDERYDNITNKDQVKKYIERLEDTMDASLDLLFYEAGYQVTQGNLSQAAAAMDATKGEIEPPAIESIKTRIPGTGINHKLVMIFPEITEEYTIEHPRALVEPSVEKWLEENIGPMDAIKCQVEVQNPSDDSVIETLEVALTDLDIGYQDFLYVSEEPISDGASELELRIQAYVKEQRNDPSEDVKYTIINEVSNNDKTFTEAIEVVRYAKDLLHKGRYLKSDDLSMEDEVIRYNREALNQIKEQRLSTVLERLLQILQSDLTQKEILIFLSKLDFESAKTLLFEISDIEVDILRKSIEQKISLIETLLVRYDEEQGFYSAFEYLKQAAKYLFGESFVLLPPASGSDDFVQVMDSEQQQLIIGNETNNTAEQIWGQERISNWVQGVAQVKENTESFEDWLMVNKLWNKFSTYEYNIVQGPTLLEYPWIGLSKKEIDLLIDQEYTSHPIYTDAQSGEAYPLTNGNYYPDNTEATVVYAPKNRALQTPVFGFVIEEFSEHIPNEKINTGLSFNYDTPNSEPPQALLLAVHPKSGDDNPNGFSWEEHDLRDILYDTMDLYKIRMIDVEAIQDYGYVLPMTYWFNIPSNK